MALPIEILITIAYNDNMALKARWLGIVLIFSLALGWFSAFAQTVEPPAEDQHYYPQHGHWVTKEFLDFYQSVPDPGKIFGYPITESFHDISSNHIVQYFENTRFELFPDNPPELRVKQTPLGVYFYDFTGQELQLPENFPACKYFLESRKQVCYAFLDYFEANGGAAQFGYPISNFEIRDGLIVQYFQYARFEWHPELPQGEHVLLTDLGSRYFKKVGEDPIRLMAAAWLNPDSGSPQTILSLQVRAFPQYAVLPQTGAQTVYIIVQDQNLLPVSDVLVILTIKLPSGKEQRIALPGSTDKFGVIKFTFDYAGQPTGVAQVWVTALYENFQKQSVTSFRIWY